jgi:hypothetical protein
MFLRIDIDHPYSGQFQNYVSILLCLSAHKHLRFNNYLEDAKILCKLLNQYNATATWFPTIVVTPDKELMNLLNGGQHEVGCQFIWRESEIGKLEKELGMKIKLYVIHGTGTPLNKMIWRRFRPPTIRSREIVKVGFDINFDKLCYGHSPNEILELFQKLSPKTIVATHPLYLKHQSILSKKGPTLDALQLLLKNRITFEKITPDS